MGHFGIRKPNHDKPTAPQFQLNTEVPAPLLTKQQKTKAKRGKLIICHEPKNKTVNLESRDKFCALNTHLQKRQLGRHLEGDIESKKNAYNNKLFSRKTKDHIYMKMWEVCREVNKITKLETRF